MRMRILTPLMVGLSWALVACPGGSSTPSDSTSGGGANSTTKKKVVIQLLDDSGTSVADAGIGLYSTSESNNDFLVKKFTTDKLGKIEIDLSDIKSKFRIAHMGNNTGFVSKVYSIEEIGNNTSLAFTISKLKSAYVLSRIYEDPIWTDISSPFFDKTVRIPNNEITKIDGIPEGEYNITLTSASKVCNIKINTKMILEDDLGNFSMLPGSPRSCYYTTPIYQKRGGKFAVYANMGWVPSKPLSNMEDIEITKLDDKGFEGLIGWRAQLGFRDILNAGNESVGRMRINPIVMHTVYNSFGFSSIIDSDGKLSFYGSGDKFGEPENKKYLYVNYSAKTLIDTNYNYSNYDKTIRTTFFGNQNPDNKIRGMYHNDYPRPNVSAITDGRRKTFIYYLASQQEIYDYISSPYLGVFSNTAQLAFNTSMGLMLNNEGNFEGWGTVCRRTLPGCSGIPIIVDENSLINDGRNVMISPDSYGINILKQDGTLVRVGRENDCLDKWIKTRKNVRSIYSSHNVIIVINKFGDIDLISISNCGITSITPYIPVAAEKIIDIVANLTSVLAIREDGVLVSWNIDSQKDRPVPDGIRARLPVD